MANLYMILLVLVNLFQYPVSSRNARNHNITKRSPPAIASGDLPLVNDISEYYDIYTDESDWQLSHFQLEMEEPELTVYTKEVNIFSSDLSADDAYDPDLYNDGIVYGAFGKIV